MICNCSIKNFTLFGDKNNFIIQEVYRSLRDITAWFVDFNLIYKIRFPQLNSNEKCSKNKVANAMSKIWRIKYLNLMNKIYLYNLKTFYFITLKQIKKCLHVFFSFLFLLFKFTILQTNTVKN